MTTDKPRRIQDSNLGGHPVFARKQYQGNDGLLYVENKLFNNYTIYKEDPDPSGSCSIWFPVGKAKREDVE